MKTINKIILLSLFTVGLSACGGFFDKDNTPPPSPLVGFTPEAKTHSLWYSKTGSGSTKDYLKLTPAVTDTTIYTADKNGKVAATDKNTGATVWTTSTDVPVTGGPGAGSGIVVICGLDGDIYALSQVQGHILWKQKTSSEILAAPAIMNNIVLVKAIDGRVTAYSTHDGHLLWTYQQVEPNLILRGSSSPEVSNNTAVVGFANGNLSKLTLSNGNLVWQKTISIPEGSFAIQRMVDIDANPLISGKRIYVAAFQGRIVAIDSASGQDIWTHDISSFTGIAADNEHVYVTDAKSNVWAFNPNSGNVDWRQPQLEARNITAPVVMGNYIVVGDAEGYLHWMSKQDGHFVARVKVDGSGIIAAPVVNNGILYVLTKGGHLAAYQL